MAFRLKFRFSVSQIVRASPEAGLTARAKRIIREEDRFVNCFCQKNNKWIGDLVPPLLLRGKRTNLWKKIIHFMSGIWQFGLVFLGKE
jgi:hypothetical protein